MPELDLGPVEVDDQAATVYATTLDAQSHLIGREFYGNQIQNQVALLDRGLKPRPPIVTHVVSSDGVKKIAWQNDLAPDTDPLTLGKVLTNIASGTNKRFTAGGFNFGIGRTVMALAHSPHLMRAYVTVGGKPSRFDLIRNDDYTTRRPYDMSLPPSWYSARPNMLTEVMYGKSSDHNTVRTPYKADRSIDWKWPLEHYYARFFDHDRRVHIQYHGILSQEGENGVLVPIAERMEKAPPDSVFTVRRPGYDIIYIWDDLPIGDERRVAPYPIHGIVWRPKGSPMSEIYCQTGDYAALKTPGYFLLDIGAAEARRQLSVFIRLPDGGDVEVTQHRENLRNKGDDLNNTIKLSSYIPAIAEHMPQEIKDKLSALRDDASKAQIDELLNEIIKEEAIVELTVEPRDKAKQPVVDNEQKTDNLKPRKSDKKEQTKRWDDGEPAGYILPKRKPSESRNPQGGAGEDPTQNPSGTGQSGQPIKRAATPPTVVWYAGTHATGCPPELDFAYWGVHTKIIHANSEHPTFKIMLEKARVHKPNATAADIERFLVKQLQRQALMLLLEVQVGARTHENLMCDARINVINSVATTSLFTFLTEEIKEFKPSRRGRGRVQP